MDSASSAPDPLASMEKVAYAGQETDAEGTEQRSIAEIRRQRTWTMVELGGLAHERGLSQEVLRQIRTRVAAGSLPKTSMCYMNRRVRNRTHGGVGGRRG